jgi:acyl-CoA synthetase (AMP-forming)/AMP-acid ligase II
VTSSSSGVNRGGFKILPETVWRVISLPSVRDACVVGVPDARLGQVPFAAVEVVSGMSPPADDELEDLVRQALPAYHVPVAFAAVDAQPVLAGTRPGDQPQVTARGGLIQIGTSADRVRCRRTPTMPRYAVRPGTVLGHLWKGRWTHATQACYRPSFP